MGGNLQTNRSGRTGGGQVEGKQIDGGQTIDVLKRVHFSFTFFWGGGQMLPMVLPQLT